MLIRKRSDRMGPDNPKRFDPDHWWRTDADGKRYWAGPCYGTSWAERFGAVEGWKPSPSNYLCWFHKHLVHHDICARQVYECCGVCSVPDQLGFRVGFRLSNGGQLLANQLEGVLDSIRLGACDEREKPVRVRLRLIA